MKIVISIDSFKGSLSSKDAGMAVRDGILQVYSEKDVKIIVKPLADGGEGTIEALLSCKGGDKIEIDVTGPLGNKVSCTYGILKENKTAVIEMAEAAGIKLVPSEYLNPMNTTTYGVGEIIADAVKRGCRDFIIGIGGSATNDGGIGMLQALGYEFYDSDCVPVGSEGKELARISGFSDKGSLKALKDCSFRIACDVNNPLYGPNGAAYVYGPQKGAGPDIVEYLDCGLRKYSEVIKNVLGKDTAHIPGAGAAGGLGYAFVTFLNAELESGIQFVLNEINLEEDILNADLVITGEGKLDFQTIMGKAPIGVAKLAKKYGKTVIAFAGAATEDADKCNIEGIDAYFDIIRMPMSVEEAMEYNTAKKNLVSTAAQVFRLIKAIKQQR